MTDEARRNEIRRLADKHQEACQQQISLGYEIKAAGFQMTAELRNRLDQSIAAEKNARDEFNVARQGWHETIYVKPIR